MEPVDDNGQKSWIEKITIRYWLFLGVAAVLMLVGLIWVAWYLEEMKKGVTTTVTGKDEQQRFTVKLEEKGKGGTVFIQCDEDKFEDAFTQFRKFLEIEEPALPIPGGPMIFALATGDLPKELQPAKRATIEVLKRISPDRIVLLAHSDCLIYDTIAAWQDRLDEVRQRQLTDLEKTARLLREWFPKVQIDVYYALRDGDKLVFNPIIVPLNPEEHIVERERKFEGKIAPDINEQKKGGGQ